LASGFGQGFDWVDSSPAFSEALTVAQGDGRLSHGTLPVSPVAAHPEIQSTAMPPRAVQRFREDFMIKVDYL
jgi:hypothetical protein